jgi:hypothetical protein
MKIIFDNPDLEAMRSRHILLELDTVMVQDQPRRFYCVLDDFDFTEFPAICEYAKQHQRFMDLYRARAWSQCLMLLDQLEAHELRDMQSFYHEMRQRLTQLMSALESEEILVDRPQDNK